MNAEPGDLLLMVADTEDVVCQSLGTLRHAPGELPEDGRRHQEGLQARLGDRLPVFPSTRRKNAGRRTIIRSGAMAEDLPKLESDTGTVRPSV